MWETCIHHSVEVLCSQVMHWPRHLPCSTLFSIQFQIITSALKWSTSWHPSEGSAIPTGKTRCGVSAIPTGNTRCAVSAVPTGNTRCAVSAVPTGNTRCAVSAVPAGNTRCGISAIPTGNTRCGISAIPTGNTRCAVSAIPTGNTRCAVSAVPTGNTRCAVSAVPTGNTRCEVSAVPAGNTRCGISAIPTGNTRCGVSAIPTGSTRCGVSAVPSPFPVGWPVTGHDYWLQYHLMQEVSFKLLGAWHQATEHHSITWCLTPSHPASRHQVLKSAVVFSELIQLFAATIQVPTALLFLDLHCRKTDGLLLLLSPGPDPHLSAGHHVRCQ